MVILTNSTEGSKIKSAVQNPKHPPPFRATKAHHPMSRLIGTTLFVVLFIGIELNINAASAEYFSSVDSLRELRNVEAELIQAISESLRLQQNELEKYRRFIDFVKFHHSIAEDDVNDYLENPINGFTLIKRVTTDWFRVYELINSSPARKAFTEVFEKFKQQNKIPDENELRGAAEGLARIQKVYNMSAHDLANGELQGIHTGTVLSLNDCFNIGGSLFYQNKRSEAMEWFNVTLQKLSEADREDDDNSWRLLKIETLEYMALIHYELGRSEKAIEYADEILNLEPNHHMQDIRVYLEFSTFEDLTRLNPMKVASYMHNYTQLCQGIQIPQKETRMLECSMETFDKPNLFLAPLKIEQISEDPPINLYHGVLTDVQIARILEEAEKKVLQRSTISNSSCNIPSDERISQNAWLPYESPVMRSAYRLVEQITGLTLKNAEPMQVANYGIGGHYEPHYDTSLNFEDEPGLSDWPGKRLATSMFYLSDVAQGGFTVFPHINLFTRPIKGALINWFNLHKSVDADRRLLHAGCPVIIGSKRIGTIWTHAGYQEFHRPCDLQSDTYKSEAYKKV